MTTLYRKWRPQTFADVFGQERVVRTLQNALAAGRVGHAYLFCGPRGVGKTTTARLLAKAVNCLHDDGPSLQAAGGVPPEPDNTCSMCVQITEGRSLDVVEIDAASNGRVDDARDLRDQINFAPNEARYKFYIIDEAHQITKDAFDALLKTFEEPPPHVIFVLATTDPNKVPATILSRCQRFDFRRHSVADIRASLTKICIAEGIEAEPAALELLARAADGSSRDSQSLLDQAIAFCGSRLAVDGIRGMLGLASADTIDRLAEALLLADARAGLELINAATDAGVDPRGLNRELVEHLRSLLLLKVSSDTAATLDVAPEALPELRQQAAGLSAAVLVRQIKIFSEADYGFRSALQAQLPLELAFLQAIDAAKAPAEVAPPAPPPAAPAKPPFSFGTSSRQPASPRSPSPAPERRPVAGGREADQQAAGQTGSAPAAAGTVASDGTAGPRVPGQAGSETFAGRGDLAAAREAPGAPDAAATAIAADPQTPSGEQAADLDAGQGVAGDPAAYTPPSIAEETAAYAQATPSGEGASLGTISEQWQRVLQIVSGQSKNVEALLRSCAPIEIDGATVTLQCEAPFHANKLQEPANKRMLEGALSRVAGRPCYVKCVVREKKTDTTKQAVNGLAHAAKPDENDPLVRAALRMLNARVLENN